MERRTFVRNTGAAVAWTALSASKVMGANDRVHIALVGCGGRGTRVMQGMLQAPNTELVAACDVYDRNAQRANTQLAEGKATMTRDFRTLLDRDDIDGVYVATPDHWHAIPAVMFMVAGKHTFVEKPVCQTVKEGRAMVEAAKRTGKICMPATQHRSAPHIIEAAEMVQSGKIGNVSLVRVWNSGYSNVTPVAPDSEPPEDLDWDFYLGPSPKVPFNSHRLGGTYRNYYDYAGGYITDFGNHRVDSVHHIMNVMSPLAVQAFGRRVRPEAAGDIFDLHVATYEYPGFIMEYVANWVNGHGLGGRTEGHNNYRASAAFDRPHGFAFYGDNGTLMVDRIGWELYTKPTGGGRRRGGGEQEEQGDRGTRTAFQGADATALHAQNFVKQVRAGEEGPATALIGHTSTSTCHLGTIAAKVGRRLVWDSKKEEFKNDPEASRLLTRELRPPYNLIKI